MSENSVKNLDNTSRFFGLLGLLIPADVIIKYLNIENVYLFKALIVIIVFTFFTQIELNNKNTMVKKLHNKLADQSTEYDDLKRVRERLERNSDALITQDQNNKDQIRELKDANYMLQMLYENYKATSEQNIHDTAAEIEKRVSNVLFLYKKN